MARGGASLFTLLSVAVVFVCCHGQMVAEECGRCQPEACPMPVNCTAGMVKDRCDCCMMCGQREGNQCDVFGAAPKYGKCGDDMECRFRPDNDQRDGARREALCYCRFTETLCGSDGKTYKNLCRLMESAYETRASGKIRVAHRGPCESAPWIASPPEDGSGYVGEDVALTCEVMGFPVPTIEWTFTGIDGKNQRLPSDIDHIAVQARGGPEQYEVTSWLQIQGLRPNDEGQYVCIGTNAMGTVESTARVTVLDKGKFENKLWSSRENSFKNYV